MKSWHLSVQAVCYKAKDTRLDRIVAIKVPLDAFMQERKLRRKWRISPLATMVPLIAVLLMARCADRESGPAVLTADLPLHLEDHLDAATIEGSEVPEDIPKAVEWRFDEPQPGWKPLGLRQGNQRVPELTRTEEGLRLDLSHGNFCAQYLGRYLHYGAVYVEIPERRAADWAYIVVKARASAGVRDFGTGYELAEDAAAGPWPFRVESPGHGVVSDGSIHTYVMPAALVDATDTWDGVWRQLGIWFMAGGPSTVDIVSVRIVPKEAAYAGAAARVTAEFRERAYHRVLYTHTPASVEYLVRLPVDARLNVGLGVVRPDSPVTFTITAVPEDGDPEVLLHETHTDEKTRAQRELELAQLAGRTVTLRLEADADRPGTVALWAAPTLSGSRSSDKPNVIFYVIDGAGADFMSVYGYNRRTTPYLERISAEGAVFDHAYSNSSWSKPSTTSFMTSLHNSVLGGTMSYTDPLPAEALTMAQHLHRAGYQTDVFTSKPLAGSASNLDREVDYFRDSEVENNSASSLELHRDFLRWRDAHPAQPYWVHFQTTDVHKSYRPVPPFAGLFVSPELREEYYEWDRRVAEAGGYFEFESYEQANVDRVAHANAQQGLYDETLAHNDFQLSRLVERLRARGEWEHTLLIVAADHGYPAAGHRWMDPLPPKGQRPLLRMR